MKNIIKVSKFERGSLYCEPVYISAQEWLDSVKVRYKNQSTNASIGAEEATARQLFGNFYDNCQKVKIEKINVDENLLDKLYMVS